MNRNGPDHWKLMKFLEVAEVVTGSTPSTKQKEYFGGEVPFVTPTELNGGIPVTKTPVTLTELGAKQVKVIPENSVMICCIGSLGKIGVAGTRLATNQQINSLVFDEKIVCHRYGFHYCQTLKPLLTQLAPTTTVPIINKGRFQELQIPLPPLPEQRRIAAILDKADSIRRKRQEAGRLTEELLRSVFLDMFGDPGTNPKGWSVQQLADVVASGRIVTYGIVQAGPHKDDGVPYIRTGDIKDGKIKTEGLLRTSKEVAQSYKRSEVNTGDLVMSIRATVGTVAPLPDILDGANLTQGTARISPGPNVMRDYLLWAIRSNASQQWIQQHVKGATFKEITLAKLRELPILVPPMHLQKKFKELSNKHNSLISNMTTSREHNDTLFNSLLQRSFKGGGSLW